MTENVQITRIDVHGELTDLYDLLRSPFCYSNPELRKETLQEIRTLQDRLRARFLARNSSGEIRNTG